MDNKTVCLTPYELRALVALIETEQAFDPESKHLPDPEDRYELNNALQALLQASE